MSLSLVEKMFAMFGLPSTTIKEYHDCISSGVFESKSECDVYVGKIKEHLDISVHKYEFANKFYFQISLPFKWLSDSPIATSLFGSNKKENEVDEKSSPSVSVSVTTEKDTVMTTDSKSVDHKIDAMFDRAKKVLSGICSPIVWELRTVGSPNMISEQSYSKPTGNKIRNSISDYVDVELVGGLVNQSYLYRLRIYLPLVKTDANFNEKLA